MTGLHVLVWTLVCVAVGAGCWLKAEAERRDDRYDRVKLRGMWWLFDADGRTVVGLRVCAVVCWVASVAVPALTYPWATAAIAAAAVGCAAGWWHRRRSYTPPAATSADDHAGAGWTYAVGLFDPFTGRMDRIKIGETDRPVHVRAAELEDEYKGFQVRPLAYGPGGRPREKAIHARLVGHRYPRSESFQVDVAVAAEVGRLEFQVEDVDALMRKAAR